MGILSTEEIAETLKLIFSNVEREVQSWKPYPVEEMEEEKSVTESNYVEFER